MRYNVVCKSGAKGREGRLHELYPDLEEFKLNDEAYDLVKKLGYKNAKEAWESNPLCQLSANPQDFCKVNA